MQRVAIYCRLSEEDKNKANSLQDSESIQNQKSMLTAYALQQGWEIYNIYSDEDYSGIDLSRPEFNRLLKDAESKKFNIILCKTQSRFTRDMEMVEKYIHNKFLEWNVRFVTSVDNVDTNNKGNKKARQINGLVNEWFLEDLSENIRSVLNNKRNTGQYIGTFFPYGYLKDPDNKTRLIIDPAASQTVKRIFDLYISGYGVTRIAQYLNEQGIPNPTAYKRQQGHPYKSAKHSAERGHLWSYTTVREVLRNQIYLGNMVQGKYKHISYKNQKLVRIPQKDWIVVANTHEPIIEQELFDKVQRRLSSNAHPQTGNGKISLFAGKVFCIHCGGSMHKTYSKQIAYLHCRTKEQHPSGCKGARIRFSLLEQAVLGSIQDMARQYHTAEYLKSTIRQMKKTPQRLNDLELQRDSMGKEIDGMAGILLNLYTDKAKGMITEAQFVVLNKGLTEKEAALRSDLAAIERQIEITSQIGRKQISIADIFSKYDHLPALNRDIVEQFIDYIEIGHDKTGQSKIVNIHWNI